MKPRNKMLRVRLRDEEYSYIENTAWSKGQKVAEYVRDVLVPRDRSRNVVAVSEVGGVRSETITVKVSVEEKQMLKASAGDVSLSGYVRFLLLGAPAKPLGSVIPREVVRDLDDEIVAVRDEDYQEID